MTEHSVFRAGDLVQLTDPKGRMHTISLVPAAVFHTHRGSIAHDALIGQTQGSLVTSSGGVAYLALRPLLDDFTLSMPRGAAVVYPKDAARIVGLASLGAGMRVLEAGVGSGALTCWLLRAVGEAGYVRSVERRADFAEVARANVARWFGSTPGSWHLQVGDLQDLDRHGDQHRVANFDAVILDMLAPWECLDVAASALLPGGVLVTYVATTTQLSRFVEDVRSTGHWTEPRAEESLVRTWHLDGLSVRPDHRMIGHTGFLVAARRLAPGTQLPPRRRRPAPGAYGDDYVAARGLRSLEGDS
ncbi:MAG: tRNA (adenine-N1)-methyltransferase [Actinomycetales bacterium]